MSPAAGGGLIFDATRSHDHAWHAGVRIGFTARLAQILAGSPARRRDRLDLPQTATS